MSAVGVYLRDLRERQGISLEELSRSTRVLHHYLEALETDDLASLPAPVFTKGFIRAYCQVLGVSSDEAIALYDLRAGQSREPTGSLAVPPPPAPDHHARAATSERREGRGRGAVLISFVLLVVLGAALFAVTLALQSGREEVDGKGPADAAAPPQPEPIPTPAAEPAESAPAPPPVAAEPLKRPPSTQPSAGASERPAAAPSVTAPSVSAPVPPSPSTAQSIVSPYRLVARTTETTWIRVRTEDGRTSEETIPANEVREWVSNGPFVLTIGNAGGVSLELNGRPIPRLGASGAVVTRLVLPPDIR
ncbi:MAG TPA: RodZ domain-containing protein [Methylomirabilota bacterium]|nr:RodZ domain-containing protein [Methylomirabilota bacterium]